MTALLVRIGFAGLRARLVPVGLTLALVAAAAATATLAVQVDRVAGEPWQRTFDATRGAHVLVTGDRAAIAPVTALPGVADAAGPIESVATTLRTGDLAVGLRAIDAGDRPSAVERPLVTDGSRVTGAGQIVLERSYAGALGLRPGDAVTVATTSGPLPLRVVGLAVRASAEPYPDAQPGVGLVAPATLAAIQPDPGRRAATVAVRLDDPAASGAFVRRAAAAAGPGVVLDDWRDRRAAANDRNRVTTIVLGTFSAIVLIAVGLMVATFMGARVVEQRRELALLKAQGLTPRQLVLVTLVENVAVAFAGAMIGVTAGVLLAPRLVRDSADLVGTVPASISPVGAMVVVLAVVGVAAVATAVPAARVGRGSTMRVLAGADAPVRALPPRLGRVLPLEIGIKQALARPGRTVAVLLALCLGTAGLAAVLGMEATLSREDVAERAESRQVTLPADPAGLAPSRLDPVDAPDLGREQIRPIARGLATLLLVAIVANLMATVILSVRERTRDAGILRSLGFTPRQVVGSLLASQAAFGAVAAIVGVPLGLALFAGVYRLAGGSAGFLALPPAWQLVLTPIAVTAAVALVSAVPARHSARLSIVDALRRE